MVIIVIIWFQIFTYALRGITGAKGVGVGVGGAVGSNGGLKAKAKTEGL